jgi:leucyl-tRNA synthetase
VLAYWAQDDTFQASVEERPAGVDGSNEFVFYDGPPFANGLPHYGHLLTGYVKDIVPRYETMRGKRVERRFGWDTHGLPAELEAMSQLGIKTKDEILEMGIETFNEVPRVGHDVHRGVAGLRHPPGPLGRLRQRLQDAEPDVHGVGASGPSRRCTTRAGL